LTCPTPNQLTIIIMARFTMTLALLVAAAISSASAFGGVAQPSSASKSDGSISRRESLAKTAAAFVGVVGGISMNPLVALAEPTDETPRIVTRMGGLLVSSIWLAAEICTVL
jgi:hypothetical protein